MSKSFFETKKWKTIMNFIYGIGAAVVIVGALFKILHWPGANVMLMVGLFTEAGIFVISAFEPVHQDVDWSLVYPELAGMEGDRPKRVSNEDNGSVSKQLDKMLESSNVGPELIASLGTGLQSLSTNVGQMSELSSASVATTEYTNNVQKAAKTMEEITASSGAVNSSLNNFSGGLTNILSNLAETEGTTVNFKENLGKLNNNLSNLNTVYGNMLSAMGGTKA